MDILLGGGGGELGKLLRGKNAATYIALLPSLLAMLGGKSGGQSGLDAILGGFAAGGLGDIIGSWVGKGPNKRVTPGQVKKGLGPAKLAQLSSQTGLSEAEVTKGLSALLPVVVNHVTPSGQVPHPSVLESALAGISGMMPRS